MKKLLFRIALMSIVLVGGVWLAYVQIAPEVTEWIKSQQQVSSSVPSRTEIDSRGVVWIDDQRSKYSMVLFESPLEFVFVSNQAQSLQEQSKTFELDVAVNGSYYIGSFVDSVPSGLLQIKGRKYSEYVPNVQVTHVIVYNHKINDIQFVRAKELDYQQFETEDYSLIQTGPIIIKNNQIQTQFIDGSLNGSERSFRTVLGVTQTGQRFLMVTKKAYSLYEVADLILKEPKLKHEVVEVINLDGGASTAMYSREFPRFNFRENIRLPLVIGFK